MPELDYCQACFTTTKNHTIIDITDREQFDRNIMTEGSDYGVMEGSKPLGI